MNQAPLPASQAFPAPSGPAVPDGAAALHGRISVAVIGAGPAGLMAAEVLAAGGAQVEVFDAMPSVGRKFLLAGRGGLNLTHAEPYAAFVTRYGAGRAALEPALQAFGPQALRDWAHGLGIDTFVGSSGRVFPQDMKAAPLLRAWLNRLRAAGVVFHTRHHWQGWDAQGALSFMAPASEVRHRAQATVLALGGASWPQLGSDGRWWPDLQARGVALAPLRPANCGFDLAPDAATGRIGWSDYLRERHAGQPVKPVVASTRDLQGRLHRQQGEFVLTDTGVEGSLVYALAVPLRDTIEAQGRATLWLDLLPDHPAERVAAEVAHPRGSRSLASHLKSRLHLGGLKLALLHEVLGAARLREPAALATALKALPLELGAPRPLAECISTAGGVRFEALDAHGMLHALPGVFCAGEMLDWEAPTGGYLLTACCASGRAAGLGVLAWARQAGAGGARPSA